MNYLFGVSLLVLGGTAPSIAWAEEQVISECACPMTPAEFNGTQASISAVSGSVMVSQKASFVDAGKNAPISLNDRVITGNNSSASLLVGGKCAIKLGANSSATVVQGQQICFRVLGEESAASLGAPEILFLGAAAGAGAAALMAGDRDAACVSGC
ncbi:hypothetical protein [Oryzicola mucosus]|uniref:Uncharacterized protein n=1 Tax=Oryzicola mucosus TaxID=2767425 RepID=A0A8J6PL73_9HYPH|nr:hypothetical protein [Oryzicola mucosus]MBD0413467.1 hypothetical protein [Oryzicola mucosus]